MTEVAPQPRPRAPAELPRWSLVAALVGWMAAQVSGGVMAVAWMGVTGDDLRSLGTIGAGQVGLWLGMVAAVVVVSRRRGSGSLAADFGLRMRPVDPVIGLPLGIACQLLLVSFIVWVVDRFTDVTDLDKAVREVAEEAHGPAYIVFAVVVAVGAPLVEELFFRGLLLRALQGMTTTWVTVATSSLLFGLAHLAGGAPALQLPALVALGVVLGVLVVRTGRLGPAIWAHAAFNGVTVVALFFDT